jgi:uncharacterized protein
VTGTIINVLAILVGGALGLLFGARLPARVRQTVIAGLGLFTAALGISMFLQTQNSLIVLGSLLVGGLLGEWWRLEDGLRNLGGFLERKVGARLPGSSANGDAQLAQAKSERFIRGFLTASLVFSIGPMAILGSIQDGLTGDFSTLAIKSMLDAFGAMAFASTLGVGVLFSSLVLLVYQGGISLLAAQANAIITPAMMTEMTATGGVLLVGIAISGLLEIKPIRMGSFLPALFVAPLIVAALAWLAK